MFRNAALLLVALLGAAQAVPLDQFLTDPLYAPIKDKAVAAPSCLTDPAVSSGAFQLELCNSVLQGLQQINGGASSVSIDCEPECADTLYKLSPDCLSQLTTAFQGDTSAIGMAGTEFLAECASVHNGGGAAAAPAPAPEPFGAGGAVQTTAPSASP